MTRKFGKTGAPGVIGPEEALHRAIQTMTNQALDISTAVLTDNSGGTAIATRILVAPATQVDEADAGTDLATGATLTASLDAVGDALTTMFAKANTIAAILDTRAVTDSSGFTDGTGTIAAIGDGGIAAAVGPQATETNASVAILQAMQSELVSMVNPIARATGQTELSFATDDNDILDGTVAAITNDTGTPADPGIKKAAADALMVVMENNVATIAAVINAALTFSGPQVVAV